LGLLSRKRDYKVITRILWMWMWFRKSILVIPGRVIALIFIIFLLVFPIFSTNEAILRIIIFSLIYSLYAVSWDTLAGFTGQVNLGHALFFGVAAYASAMLNQYIGLPPLLTIPMGSLAGALVGLIGGLPALRLRGFYLGLVTLAFPIILSGIIFIFTDFTGGEAGLYGLSSLSDSKNSSYYIILATAGCSIFILYKLTDARSRILRTGLLFRAIREDEMTARASGIDTIKYKLLAFVMSGFFAGIAGGLYAHYIRIAGPGTLELSFSIQAVLWTIFGGMATIYGPIAGVFILYPLSEYIRFLPHGEEIRFILLSLILICSLIFMPEGITVWIRDKLETECTRCKVMNMATRRTCRACRAPLYLSKEEC
jgi:branched-chain amino acid transport system permease protein